MIVLLGCAASLAGLLWWAAGGRQQPGTFDDEIRDFGGDRAPAAARSRLVVMTWNIAYARGTAPDNDANAPVSAEEVRRRLARMGQLVRKQRVDLLLLQEIDFASRRSCYVDQLAELARHSGLRYAARAVSWRANWVPHPLWPPQRQYGRMLSGGAVLSRFPIRENRVLLHPKPAANNAIYNAFYLFRYAQQVQLEIGSRRFWAINNHLEAFRRDNRLLQARHLLALAKRLGRGRVPLLVVGGDMNAVPPEAQRKHGFPDGPDDYRNDETVSVLRRLPRLREIAPLARYRADPTRHFTFPTGQPNRRLDYLFVAEDAGVERYEMVRTGAFSDHLPVVAELRLPGEREVR